MLVESLKAADRDLSKAQARLAQLMVEFADSRKRADRHRLAGLESSGGEPRYKPGEFAAMEIGLAVTATRHSVQRVVARAGRLQAEAPDVWDAWIAGDINEAKAVHINHALLRLVREDSKRLLNALVVPVAVVKTPELLRRWLNRFVARVEPEETDERIRRSLEDRFVSVRPDLDGVSFLNACLSSLDAASVDLMLDALAGIAEPGDSRTKQQRRADALVDLLMGRISNGWQPGGEGCEPDELDADAGAVGGCDCSAVGGADRFPGSDRSWDDDGRDPPAGADAGDADPNPEPADRDAEPADQEAESAGGPGGAG